MFTDRESSLVAPEVLEGGGPLIAGKRKIRSSQLGRVCACGTVLSRYNHTELCAPCTRRVVGSAA